MGIIVDYHEMAWHLVSEVSRCVGIAPVNTTVEGTDMAICPIHITWETWTETDGRNTAKVIQDILTSDRWQGRAAPGWKVCGVFRDNRLDGGTYRFRIMAGPIMAMVTCPEDRK